MTSSNWTGRSLSECPSLADAAEYVRASCAENSVGLRTEHILRWRHRSTRRDFPNVDHVLANDYLLLDRSRAVLDETNRNETEL